MLPTATDTPLPTRTPVPTPAAPFVLLSKEKVCDPNLPAPLIQVQTLDADGQPVPGVEIIINWGTSEENHFFTGLKAELGQGYADFTMTPDVVYTLRLAGGGQPIPDLQASECEAVPRRPVLGFVAVISLDNPLTGSEVRLEKIVSGPTLVQMLGSRL